MQSKQTSGFLRHMPMVEAYSQRLAALQNVWDSLSLLSQMSGDGANMGHTREAFESLSHELVKQLSAETSRTAVLELCAKAQVAIDVMVRNLFERTADIGFLCTDDEIVQFMRQAAGGAEVDAHVTRALRQRLREYAAKYSVYQNIVLLGVDGTVLMQLDDGNTNRHSSDPLLAATLNTTQPYLESYGVTDLAPGGKPALIYSYRVQAQQQTLGILCLCFRFEDETRAIFNKLLAAQDWTVLTLLDATGRVIASSDEWQVPLNAPLTLALQEEGSVIRFAGREYLALTRRTQGYQGYVGPGWLAHAMVPLEHAFEPRSSQVLSGIAAELLASVHRSADIFSDELRAIPLRADRIQRELNQAVWNGNVKLTAPSAGHNGRQDAFSKSLLREISTTGRRTKEVFEQSIGDLHETVVATILHDSRLRASLAVEIMDRNLYERANDCRWWALNDTLRQCLMGNGETVASRVLEHINGLYTVYDNILLFDRQGQVIAVSNAKRNEWRGKILDQSWVRDTLMLRDTQAFAVSAFEPLAAYDDRHTYVFTAAVRGDDGQVLGGIAVVFDSQPQFNAMLHDVVPPATERDADERCCALLLDTTGKVIAATSRYQPGDLLQLPAHLMQPAINGVADIILLDGMYYAVGARRCTGYREFAGVGATALVMTALGAARAHDSERAAAFKFARAAHPVHHAIDLATVSCGLHWLAIRKEQVVEAISADAITRVPGRAAWLLGVTRYEGALLPVVDLGHWLGKHDESPPHAVVVLRDGERRMGLAIDQLGDVLEIGADEIATIDALHTVAQRQLTPQIVRTREANDTTLLLLDSEVLLSMLRPPLQRAG